MLFFGLSSRILIPDGSSTTILFELMNSILPVWLIGLGYVGLCQAVGMAKQGYNVIGVDIDKEKVKKINQKKAPFYEEGLKKLSKTTFRSSGPPVNWITGYSALAVPAKNHIKKTIRKHSQNCFIQYPPKGI